MVRKSFLFALLLVSAGLFAQGIVIYKGWEVKSGQNPQSEVGPNGMILRLYSSIFNNTLDHEISKITVNSTWLNPGPVDFSIQVVLRFDDGSVRLRREIFMDIRVNPRPPCHQRSIKNLLTTSGRYSKCMVS